MSFNWTCPYCNRDQAVTESQFTEQDEYINNPASVLGPVCLYAVTIRCANEKYKKLQFAISLNQAAIDEFGQYLRKADTIQSWQLLPESSGQTTARVHTKADRRGLYGGVPYSRFEPEGKWQRCRAGAYRA